MFYLTKNYSLAQVFQKVTEKLISFQTFIIFFIQAMVPSSTILQTGEAQKSNENILDAFFHSQIKCFFHSQIDLEIHFGNKTNCAFINLGMFQIRSIFLCLNSCINHNLIRIACIDWILLKCTHYLSWYAKHKHPIVKDTHYRVK